MAQLLEGYVIDNTLCLLGTHRTVTVNLQAVVRRPGRCNGFQVLYPSLQMQTFRFGLLKPVTERLQLTCSNPGPCAAISQMPEHQENAPGNNNERTKN